jgi:hypothetical protein
LLDRHIDGRDLGIRHGDYIDDTQQTPIHNRLTAKTFTPSWASS